MELTRYWWIRSWNGIWESASRIWIINAGIRDIVMRTGCTYGLEMDADVVS